MLSDRDTLILAWIGRDKKTYQEVADNLSVGKSTVKRAVFRLRDNGFLSEPKKKGAARAWQLTDKACKLLSC